MSNLSGGGQSRHNNNLTIHYQDAIASGAVSNSQIGVASNLIGVIGLSGIVVGGLLILAASVGEIAVDLTGDIVGSGNLSQVQNHVLGIGLFVQNIGSLSQSIHNDISLAIDGIMRIDTSSGLAIGGLRIGVAGIRQGNRRSRIGLISIGALKEAGLDVRRESGGAQCQSHDHGQHSCNDLLHVCFLHKNLFVSDLTSPLSPAVYNVNIIML